MKDKRRIVIKLGSRIVAGDDGELRTEVLARVCDAVASLHEAGDEVVLVSSGAIARGMSSTGLSSRPTEIAELQATSAIGQGRLYHAYEKLLDQRGLTSAQVLLTLGDLHARTNYLNIRQTLEKLIDWHAVAVVNENDTVATDEITFGDNDFLAAQIAVIVGADLLVLLTDVDGLYDSNPHLHPEAKLVDEISDFQELEALDIDKSSSTLGSGGMRSKVRAAEIAAAASIPTVICNGLVAGALEDAMAGRSGGTLFAPQ